MKQRALWFMAVIAAFSAGLFAAQLEATSPHHAKSPRCTQPTYQGYTSWPLFVLEIDDIRQVKEIAKRAWWSRFQAQLTESQKQARFWGFQEGNCRVSLFEYREAEVEANQALVVIDVITQCSRREVDTPALHRLPALRGGEEHTYCFQKFPAGWKITDDYFTVLPRYRP